MTTLKAPFPYMGGKSRVAREVWRRFGDVPNYVLCARTRLLKAFAEMSKRFAISVYVPSPLRYAAAALPTTAGSFTGGRPVSLVLLLVDHLFVRRAFTSATIDLSWKSGR